MTVRLSRLLGFMLALMAGVGFAQWDDKSFPPGRGVEDTVYMFRLAPGSSLQTKSGKVIKGGETVAVSGKNITMIDPVLVPQTIDKYGDHFANKDQYMSLPAEQKSRYAIISVKVPEGVTFTRADGTVYKGPTDVLLMVDPQFGKTMKPTSPIPEELTHPSNVPGFNG
ncbi:MAG: hypothetical protein U1F76_18785 [Candidatus Competibacteraceae bacterium]